MVKINKTNKQWLDMFKETILKTKNELNEDNDTKTNNPIKVKPKNNEGKTKEEAERTWKVRLYPSKKQNERLKRMLGIFRWTYNQCVAYYKELNEKYENKKDVPNDEKVNLSNFRLRFVNKDGIEKMKKGWTFQLNYDSRDGAVQDFIAAWKINEKMYKEKLEKEENRLRETGLTIKQSKEQAKKNISMFTMKFKSKKKKLTESLYIRERHYNQKKGNLSWLKNIRTKSKHKVEIKYDTRIIKDSIGRYYILMLKPLDKLKEEPLIHKKVISLDPGVRSFMSGYDIDGKVVEFGNGDMRKIFRLLYGADKLQSKIYKKQENNKQRFQHNHKRRENMKKAFRKIQCKVRNLIKDAHHKISKYLVENYDVVLLPKFNVSGMIKRGERKLRKKTVRQMCTWSHYKFRQIIESKSKRYGCFICPCDEYYTSKTCSQCGNINHKLKGEKEYNCKSCKSYFDRDFNGARNILIKFLCKYKE